MPRRNGTGPRGQGARTGRGRGGGSRNRGNYFGAGPGGDCICPACGFKLAQESGVPCFQMRCPKCGAMMSRKRVVALND